VKLESKLKNTSIRDFQKVIEEKYNWDLIAKQTKEVYEKVVGQ
jgi:glycosyltransferase involved in cell wall biosynthesis